jgi:hypothetical protein
MRTASKDMKELMGEHEAILAYMKYLTKSAEKLAGQKAPAKERLWNYCCALYDFKDAVWYHLEIDERVFKSVLAESYPEETNQEHEEIQRLVNDMIALADNAAIEKLGQEELNQYCGKLGKAFDRICKLIELHIARENAILQRVQQALNSH